MTNFPNPRVTQPINIPECSLFRQASCIIEIRVICSYNVSFSLGPSTPLCLLRLLPHPPIPSLCLQHNPQLIFGALSSNAVLASAGPSIPVLLKLDSGNMTVSTISKPAVTSRSTAASAAKQTGPLPAFSAAIQSSPFGTSSPQMFSFGQPKVCGSGSNATSASKFASTSEAFKPKEQKLPKLSFGLPLVVWHATLVLHRHPSHCQALDDISLFHSSTVR
ncbi:hypothetical protein EDD22DRAFT_948912 [Suillus occidentalis]|nr:hypothetical protein EDD22DRAFT_948912 [Suillus occidentalis]